MIPDIPDNARLLLGTAPDPVIARTLGVSASTVYRWRVILDVAAWGRVNAYPHRGGKPGIPCPIALRDLLGTITDRVLAARAGVSCTTARRWRTTAGKSPCRKHASKNEETTQ